MAFLVLAPALAEAPPATVTVRAGVHPDFDRVVFDWPHAVAYTIHREGVRAMTERQPATFIGK